MAPPGDMPFSESMLVSLLAQMCVTRPQRVKRQMQIYKGFILTKFSGSELIKASWMTTAHSHIWNNHVLIQGSNHDQAHHSISLQWRHNEHDGVSNHQPHGCLVSRLFRRRSKKTSKLRVTGLCEGNSPVTGEFPAQRASNAENVSIWWRHHVIPEKLFSFPYPSTRSGRPEYDIVPPFIFYLVYSNADRHIKFQK